VAIKIFHFSFLLVFWIICTGYEGFQNLLYLSIAGLLISFLISEKLDAFSKKIYKFYNIFNYLIFIFKEMVKSSLLLSAKIITNKVFDGQLIFLDSKIPNNSPERVIYCNSITFTPGTFVISADENNKIIVHAFSLKIANELKEGEIEKMILNNF